MEVREHLSILRRAILVLIFLPVIAAGAAYGVSLQLPKVYESRISVLVRQSTVFGTAEAGLVTDQTLLTRPRLLQQVISDLGLNTTPAALAGQISSQIEPGTTILDIIVHAGDPKQAQDIATTLEKDFVVAVDELNGPAPTPAPGSNPNTPQVPVTKYVVLSPASLSDAPISPNPRGNALLAGFGGLLVAVAIAYLLDSLDQSVKDVDKLNDRTGLLLIGQVPAVGGKRQKMGEIMVLGRKDQFSSAAEAYRSIRTNLLFSALGRELKSIVVTSAVKGEGKSRTAANLATVLALAGHRTVLVDVDFRRPSVHRLFGIVRNVGLSDLVLQNASAPHAVVAVDEVPNLWVCPCGTPPPNPSEFLGSPEVKDVLSRLKSEYDYMVIDTPPVTLVSDSLVVASEADGTLIIAAYGSTTYPQVVAARTALERVQANVLGVVLNKIPGSVEGYYYYRTEPAIASNGKRRRTQSGTREEAPERT